MFGCNCCFLACIQILQDTGTVAWYSHLFKNFPQLVVIHTVKDSGEAELYGFLEFLCFLHDPVNVGNMISGSSALSKSSFYIWKFSVFVLLKYMNVVFTYCWIHTYILTFIKLLFHYVQFNKFQYLTEKTHCSYYIRAELLKCFTFS